MIEMKWTLLSQNVFSSYLTRVDSPYGRWYGQRSFIRHHEMERGGTDRENVSTTDPRHRMCELITADVIVNHEEIGRGRVPDSGRFEPDQSVWEFQGRQNANRPTA